MVTTCSVKGCNSKAGQGIIFHRLPKSEISKEWIKFLEKSNPSFKLLKTCTICGLHFDSDLDYETPATSLFQTKRLKRNAVPSILNPTSKSLFCQSNTASDYNAEEEVLTLFTSDLFAEPLDLFDEPLELFTEPLELLDWSMPFGELDTVLVPTAATKHSIEERKLATEESSSDVPAVPAVPSKLLDFSMPYEEPASVLVPTAATEQSTEESSSDLSANKKRKCFVGDFKHINEIDSPDIRLQFWNASHTTVEYQRKRIKFLNKKNLMLTKQVKTLDDLVKHLKDEKNMISVNCFTVLKKMLSISVHKMVMKQLNTFSGNTVTPELRSFALTLHFYLPATYKCTVLLLA